MLDVRLNGAAAQTELTGDLAICKPKAYEFEHLPLAFGKRGSRVTLGWLHPIAILRAPAGSCLALKVFCR